MKEAKRALSVLALAITVGCSNHLTPATPPPHEVVALRIYSTEDALPLLQSLSQSFSSQYPEISLESNFNHQTNLLENLETGEMKYFISHHFPSEAQQDYWAAPLAQDAMAFIVHPENPLRSISIEDLRRIYRGYLANWQELGGEDLSISLYSREEGTSSRYEFERLVMGQERTSPNALVLPSSEAILERVANDRSAIAYLPFSLLNDTVQVLAIDEVLPNIENISSNRYALRMSLYIIGLEEPENDYRAFIAWAQSMEGQNAIADKYAPLPP